MREKTELYNQACEIISRALDAAEDEREALIDEACRDNPALRQEVDWLYDECQRTVSFVLDGVTRLTRIHAVDTPPSDLRVAAAREYAIVRELGRGGMGVVYLAERRDADYVQSVALKLLTAGAADMPQVVTRFLAERQILAELNHPNIAHLVDGGRLPDGRPFIAMEFVDGMRIDYYCASKSLSTLQRLRLFMRVCSAVHYAHQHLVIHRDIKPANIFVTAEGQPKLLDFGIARILGQKPHIVSAETVEGSTPLTLAYASPEQIEGKPLTTATDIYSLGVLLYELLAEAHPFPRDVPALELARNIREVDPRAPSRAMQEKTAASRGGTTQRWWSRGNPVAGDLDAIVLKAMRKSPSERYQTAAEFADDIGAHLDGKPVAARRGEGWYRARKFASRHRYVLGALVFAALMIIAFGVDRAFQLKKTEAALHVSEKITEYFSDVFHNAAPLVSNGQETTAHDVLVHGTDNVAKELEGEDRVKLKLYASLGESLEGMGAMRDADHALSLGLQLAETSPQSDPQTLAHYLNALAWLRIRQGQFAAAGEFAQRSVTALDGDKSAAFERGLALRYLGISKIETGTPIDQVIPLMQEALTALRSAHAPPHEIAQTHYLMARAYQKNHQFDEAVKALDDVLEDLPATPRENANRATYLMSKASILQGASRPREAQDVYAGVQPILEEVHRDSPAELDLFYTHYAYSDLTLGHYKHAVALFDRFDALCAAHPCEEPNRNKFDRLMTQARAVAGVHDFDRAQHLFDESAEVANTLPPQSAAELKVELGVARATALISAHQYDRALMSLDETGTLAQSPNVEEEWRENVKIERLNALIGASRWDDAENELKQDRTSPSWQDDNNDLKIVIVALDAQRQRWTNVARDLPATYKAETEAWGPCSDNATQLRNDWTQWAASGAPIPPAPHVDTPCDE